MSVPTTSHCRSLGAETNAGWAVDDGERASTERAAQVLPGGFCPAGSGRDGRLQRPPWLPRLAAASQAALQEAPLYRALTAALSHIPLAL
jgi:hypothetical protein